MANMSYCRFYNTRIDMNECIDALESGESLSHGEKNACVSMFERIIDYLVDEGLVEAVDDAFEEWEDCINEKED